MLTCRDASRLSSEALDRRLTLRERLSLGLHLAMCALCRRYAEQVGFMRRAISRLGVGDAKRGEGLSTEARDRIRDRLTRE